MSGELSQDVLDFIGDVVGEKIENCSLNRREDNKTGDGHFGELLFVSVETPGKDVPYELAVKQCLNLEDEKAAQFIDTVYFNEIRFYKEIAPAMTAFQEDAHVEMLDAIPKCYGISTAGTKMIAMENLKLQNFQLHDKNKSFDDLHMKLVLETYGKFHGTSFAFKCKQEDKVSSLLSPMHNLFAVFARVARYSKDKFPPVSEVADENIDANDVERIQQYLFDGIDKVAKLDASRKESILVHGDCWSNNFLFKYDESGKPIAIRILDFQICASASPVVDLSYCFYSAASKEQIDDLDHYLRLYYDSLSSRLSEFGLDVEDIYSFEQLKREWKEYAGCGIMMSSCVWKLKFSSKYSSDDPNEFFQTENKLIHFDEEAYKAQMNVIFMHILTSQFISNKYKM